ncbi:MAG: hypothetical protein JSS29_13265 [Proteobacteria bacterium]|nr:hypothetical protein [Pseudomonadota bacterium]
MGKTPEGLKRLWRPGGEALEAIGDVLGKHWRAAAGFTPSRLFWQAPGRWLKSNAGVTPLGPHHFTTGGKLIR